jgi:hypothetical protein
MPQEIAKHEWWERSSRLSLVLLRALWVLSQNAIRQKEFIQAIEEEFVSSDKVLASTLVKKLSRKTFDNSISVREHIMEMRDMSTQLKFLEVDISSHFLLISY